MIPLYKKKSLELSDLNEYIQHIEEQIGNKMYPIGSIYMSVNSANPSTLFGGTWVSWGAGKVPVGIDTNQTEFNSVEKIGGEKTHTLTSKEMPLHDHHIMKFSSSEQGAERFPQGSTIVPEVVGSTTTGWWGNTATAGGGQAHNNLQPYITCYMWKRTA